jgi:malic enzyme
MVQFNGVRLPRTTIRELYRAIDATYPRWAKIYFWFIGFPAWVYIAYRVLTADKFEITRLDDIAAVALVSTAILLNAFVFRAYWRNDL